MAAGGLSRGAALGRWELQSSPRQRPQRTLGMWLQRKCVCMHYAAAKEVSNLFFGTRVRCTVQRCGKPLGEVILVLEWLVK